MRIKPSKPSPCEECGSAPVHHKSTYATVAIDGILNRFIPERGLRHSIVRRMRRIENIFLPRLYAFAQRRGFGEFLEEPGTETLLLAKVLWEEARIRGITMREFRLFGLPRNLFVAALPHGRRISL